MQTTVPTENRSLPAQITTNFEGHRIRTLVFRGRPCWVARDLGVAIGYGDCGRNLVHLITQEWSSELVSGVDYAIMTGADLAALKLAMGDGTENSPSPNDGERHSPSKNDGARRGGARSLLVLFESGMHLALLKTHLPKGKALRRKLAEEVLPQLIRTGRYAPAIDTTPAPTAAAAAEDHVANGISGSHGETDAERIKDAVDRALRPPVGYHVTLGSEYAAILNAQARRLGESPEQLLRMIACGYCWQVLTLVEDPR